MSRRSIRRDDPEVVASRLKSYTGAAVLTLALYWVLWFPGFIANVLFYREAKEREQIAGTSLPGVGCLTIMFWLNVAALGVIVTFIVAGLLVGLILAAV